MANGDAVDRGLLALGAFVEDALDEYRDSFTERVTALRDALRRGKGYPGSPELVQQILYRLHVDASSGSLEALQSSSALLDQLMDLPFEGAKAAKDVPKS